MAVLAVLAVLAWCGKCQVASHFKLWSQAACFVDSLEKVVSLLGAVLGIPLAYIIPLIIHLRLAKDSPLWVRCVNWLVMGIGVVLAIVCAYVTILIW